MDEILATIAKRLGFETLAARGTDAHDFREVAVWQVKEALQAAYEAGRKAGENAAAGGEGGVK